MYSTACGKLFGFNSMYNAVCQSQLIRAFLKTKKWTDFPQATDRYKAKNAGILCGFRVFLTQQLALIVEKVYDFDFSDSPKYEFRREHS